MPLSLLSRFLFALCLGLVSSVFAATAPDDDIDIKVNIEGELISTDVTFLIDAKPREVWGVLTDFDHMASFVSNLTSSKVLARGANLITVEQKGKASAGLLSFAFDSVREIQLTPFEGIRSRLISGNMKRFEGVTRFSEEAGKTRIRYHSDAIPNTWVPPVLGRGFIEQQTREQFAEMRQEVARRKQTVTEH
jgi:hypothetical protein